MNRRLLWSWIGHAIVIASVLCAWSFTILLKRKLEAKNLSDHALQLRLADCYRELNRRGYTNIVEISNWVCWVRGASIGGTYLGVIMPHESVVFPLAPILEFPATAEPAKPAESKL